MAPVIEHQIWIDAPVDVVWRAVTEPEQISKWFSDEVDLAPEPGHEGALTFTDTATRQKTSVCVTVVCVEPERLFSYRWLHQQGEPASEGNSVLVEFTLTPEEGGTRLRVTETGVELMGWSAGEQDSYRRQHLEGWTTHAGRLRDHLRQQRTSQDR